MVEYHIEIEKEGTIVIHNNMGTLQMKRLWDRSQTQTRIHMVPRV